MKLIMYAAFLLFVAPCNSAKKTASSEQTSPSTDKMEIIYQRTPCFGKCPVYVLTINGATKTATFKGQSDTEKIGTYTKTLSVEELKKLATAFDKANFFALEDAYMGIITDFPVKTITYTNNGKTKKVKERHQAPKELTDLEAIIEEVANSSGWTKSNQEDTN